ncbi:hypothetical protein D9M68_330550 [compost metagenome]
MPTGDIWPVRHWKTVVPPKSIRLIEPVGYGQQLQAGRKTSKSGYSGLPFIKEYLLSHLF